jgi:hypothetical protein
MSAGGNDVGETGRSAGEKERESISSGGERERERALGSLFSKKKTKKEK